MPGYDAQQVGDATEISTTPEKVPTPWLLIAIPGGLLVLIALSMSFFYGVIAAGFRYGAMYLLCTRSKRGSIARPRNSGSRRPELTSPAPTFPRTRYIASSCATTC